MRKRKYKKRMLIILTIIAVIAAGAIIFLHLPRFGAIPKGARLERVKNSPNYRDGKFQNLHDTPQLTSDKSYVATMIDFLFKKKERLQPETPLPVIKTDLSKLGRTDDLLIWFGHSSYLLQVDGVRVLVDPVFSAAASPVSFFNKPFKGTGIYKPEDMPEVDFLAISHDHWDHLDHETVINLKPRVGKVICALGVGQHFERWGFPPEKIVEMDWNETETFPVGSTYVDIHCLPARHFSGRGLSPNQSLWASFLVDFPGRRIYLGGDSGYDTHFSDIGKHFPGIDLAILENGQYDAGWKYIHTLPEQLPDAFRDLRAKRLLTVHNSKFALGNHAWDEPLKKISTLAERDGIELILPQMGEVVNLNDETYAGKKWWEGIQ